jgi:hypothetical protein
MCVIVVTRELQHFISHITGNSLLPLYDAKLSTAWQTKQYRRVSIWLAVRHTRYCMATDNHKIGYGILIAHKS